MAKYIIKKIKTNKLIKEAVCLLPKYRKERDNFNNNTKPALLAQINEDNTLLKEARDFLDEISNYRNCITKEYYHCAGEFQLRQASIDAQNASINSEISNWLLFLNLID